MARKKTRLGRYAARSRQQKQKTTKTMPNEPSKHRLERKHREFKGPFTSPIKSPFRSPLYKNLSAHKNPAQTRQGQKRLFVRTPLKSPFKSPKRSPFRLLLHTYSPAHKRLKSARLLFCPIDTLQRQESLELPDGSLEEDDFYPLSEETASAVEVSESYSENDLESLASSSEELNHVDQSQQGEIKQRLKNLIPENFDPLKVETASAKDVHHSYAKNDFETFVRSSKELNFPNHAGESEQEDTATVGFEEITVRMKALLPEKSGTLNIDTACAGEVSAVNTVDIQASTSEELNFSGEVFDESQQNEKEVEEVINKMKNLIPNVITALSKQDGLDLVMLQFFELVSTGRFPLDNIAFLLWTEVVKWFDSSSSTRMRYSNESKTFWKLGWRIFGTRFINFMGGYKSHGGRVLKVTAPGMYTPEWSEINFAVPDVKVLRDFDPYNVKGERKPGMFSDVVDSLKETLDMKSACLTFDGKKLKQALTDDSGDVDLLGFEQHTIPLKEKQQTLTQKVNEINEMLEEIENDASLNPSDGNIEEESMKKSNVPEFLIKAFSTISEEVCDIEKLRAKKEFCKSKLIKKSGDMDWRKGRYVYAISAITAFIHDIDQYVTAADRITEDICRCIAFLHNTKFVTCKQFNVFSDDRYFTINQQIGPESSPRLIPQRTEPWHEIRNKAKVTGSTLYKAIGCDGLANQRNHFEKVICGVPEREPSVEVKKAMEHGTTNEINGVATIVGKILPIVEPKLKFCEEGYVAIEEDGSIFMVVSPDGSLRKDNTMHTTDVAIEIKCPVRTVHTEFPARYLLQCLSEIHVLETDYLLYVSWTKECATAFKVEKNEELLKKALAIAFELYGESKPKKPTKLLQSVKDLKEEVIVESKQVKMIGRFRSCENANVQNTYDTEDISASFVKDLLNRISESYTENYELRREKASEAVVFVVADLDRSWERNTIRSAPVAWFPKGYSLDTGVMRQLAESVHTLCHNGGLHIPCESFDGQWHSLVVRDADGSPLTLHQLQRDLWKKVEEMSKIKIVSKLQNLNKVATWSVTDELISDGQEYQRVITATNGGLKLPKYRHIKSAGSEKASKENDDQLHETTLADAVTDIVRDASAISEDVLALSQVTEEVEMEAFSTNVSTEEWSRELERQIDAEHPEFTEEMSEGMANELDTIDAHVPNDNESKMTLHDMQCILALFKTTKDCNKKNKWDNVAATELLEYFSSGEQLTRFLDVELRTVVRYMKKTKGLTGTKESNPKYMKVNDIAAFLHLMQEKMVTKMKRNRRQHVQPLQKLATKTVSKYSKHELNVVLAEYMWEDSYKAWVKPVEDTTVNDQTYEWFYKPEFSQSRGQFEVKCIDSSHLLTRVRRKTCKGGIEDMSNECWLKVANGKETLLTKIMVEEITDPMSVPMAKTHFSEAVECKMRSNGDIEGANLCSDIRSWWESEDMAGISSDTRLRMRESLRHRLMSKRDFSRFPPATQYVAGWPLQLWEGLIANIDAKAYLYALAHGGTYNVRAFSSMIGETFFGELSVNDKRGQGVVSAKEFGEYIGYTTEQLQIRLDQDRNFSYCTSKRKVYDVVDESYESTSHDNGCPICKDGTSNIPKCIYTRDHAFDLPGRKRLPGRKKTGHVSTTRNALLKGTLGVRWEKARCNMSKMLPSKRMGIPDDE